MWWETHPRVAARAKVSLVRRNNFVDVLMIEDGIDVLHRLRECSSAWHWHDLYVPHVPLTNSALTLAGVTAQVNPY
jgi:hypothetical protein